MISFSQPITYGILSCFAIFSIQLNAQRYFICNKQCTPYPYSDTLKWCTESESDSVLKYCFSWKGSSIQFYQNQRYQYTNHRDGYEQWIDVGYWHINNNIVNFTSDDSLTFNRIKEHNRLEVVQKWYATTLSGSGYGLGDSILILRDTILPIPKYPEDTFLLKYSSNLKFIKRRKWRYDVKVLSDDLKTFEYGYFNLLFHAPNEAWYWLKTKNYYVFFDKNIPNSFVQDEVVFPGQQISNFGSLIPGRYPRVHFIIDTEYGQYYGKVIKKGGQHYLTRSKRRVERLLKS